MTRVLVGLFSVFYWMGVQATPVTFSSGVKQTTLIELFTSQGCSSCPPAERWLNNLKNHSGLWVDFIPMAFHVDYWDRLGWKDIYASPAFTQRQYQYKESGNVRVVYTPGFFANGQEWRGWSRWFETSMPASGSEAGVLTLEVDGDTVNAAFDKGQSHDMVMNIAVLGFGINTPVKAGENSGEVLAQEFVVLGHQQGLSNNGHWQLELPALSNPAEQYAVVGWVSDVANQRPIQATGGWINYPF